MFPQVEITHNIGNIISIPNQLEVKVFTYISTNLAFGVTDIPVDNATEFTSGSILLLLSSMGASNCEFATASTHTNFDFTVTATKLPHNRGDTVMEVAWDSIIVSKSSTIGGTYTPIATQQLQTTQQNTVIFDPTGLSTDYYTVQWKNSITGNVSATSAPINVLSYPTNSVASVINPVLTAMGISENDPKINTAFCLSAIDDARKYVKAKLFGIRHAWQQVFEFPIQVLAGTNFVPLPTNIEFNESDRSLLACRFLIGNVLAPFNLRYIDKRSWNQVSWQLQGGVTTTDSPINSTTISLNSAGDFPAVSSNGGVAYVATSNFTQTTMQIAYTGVNLITNQLTGVTGVTTDIPAGTQIWSCPAIAQPIYYTVYDGNLWFDRIIPDSMQGTNLYIDFYAQIEDVTNLYQILAEPYREIYKWYLRYAIKYRKDITLPSTDADLAKFEDLVTALFNNLYTGQDSTIVTS